MEVSIVVPAFNESEGLGNILPRLVELHRTEGYEVLIIDDGSTDDTAAIVARFPEIRLIRQKNKGYGGALKSGFREATGEYVVTLDADGQHDPDEIPAMVQAARGHDLLTGVRGADSDRPKDRVPGKWVLTRFAQVVGGVEIRDINCGFRVYRRSAVLNFIHLYPDGFSQSTTSLLAFLKAGLDVVYRPIKAAARVGRKSNVKYLRDGFRTLYIILRITALFTPMRIFGPSAAFALAAGLLLGAVEVLSRRQFPVSGVIACLIAGAVFLLGLIADMLSLMKNGPR